MHSFNKHQLHVCLCQKVCSHLGLVRESSKDLPSEACSGPFA